MQIFLSRPRCGVSRNVTARIHIMSIFTL